MTLTDLKVKLNKSQILRKSSILNAINEDRWQDAENEAAKAAVWGIWWQIHSTLRGGLNENEFDTHKAAWVAINAR